MKMKLSACLIVKNEEQVLARTLPVLSRGVDEIILVDTGSTDGTVALAERYGAKVCHFAWTGDFAAARNESLKHATGDWVIWIDADEYLPAEELARLSQELATAAGDALALTLYESKLDRCDKHNGYFRVKAFRNGLGYYFARPINEQLVDAAGEIVRGENSPVAIYHWGGHLAEERMIEKREKYVQLYAQALEAEPNDPYFHFLLANKLNELQRLPEALVHYDAVCRLVPGRDVGREAGEKRADLLLRSRKLPEAMAAAKELLAADPQNIPARNVLASICLVTNQLDAAIALLTEALSIKINGRVANLYQSVALPSFLLGKAYEIKGEKTKAAECLARAREVSPEMFK